MRVSWSSMRGYEQCSLRQKLLLIDKLGPQKIDERRFIRGSTGHKFLDTWTKRGFSAEMKLQEAGTIFERLVNRKLIVWLQEGDKEKLHAQVIEDASMIIEAIHHHQINLIDDLEPEKWVSKRILSGNHELAGLIDMVAGRGAWLIEAKFSNDSKWSDPGQLIFYGLISKMATGEFPERLSFFLPFMVDVNRRLIDIKFAQNEFEKMNERILNFIDHWKRGIFLPSGKKEICHFCEVKRFCFKCPERKFL